MAVNCQIIRRLGHEVRYAKQSHWLQKVGEQDENFGFCHAIGSHQYILHHEGQIVYMEVWVIDDDDFAELIIYLLLWHVWKGMAIVIMFTKSAC